MLMIFIAAIHLYFQHFLYLKILFFFFFLWFQGVNLQPPLLSIRFLPLFLSLSLFFILFINTKKKRLSNRSAVVLTQRTKRCGTVLLTKPFIRRLPLSHCRIHCNNTLYVSTHIYIYICTYIHTWGWFWGGLKLKVFQLKILWLRLGEFMFKS